MCSLFLKAIFLTFILLHCSWCSCRVAAAERLPVLHHSADYISFPLRSLGLLWYIWECTLEGISSVAYLIIAYEVNKTDSHFLICSVFSKAIFSTFIINIYMLSTGTSRNKFSIHWHRTQEDSALLIRKCYTINGSLQVNLRSSFERTW